VTSLAIAWFNITGGSIAICATLIVLAVTLQALSRTGSKTAAAQDMLIETLEKRLNQVTADLAREQQHTTDLSHELGESAREVARLEERPSLERLLEVMDHHTGMHAENSRKLDAIQGQVTKLVNRDRPRRRDDRDG
jgi:predicted house-cleaning noncanonical NTP pyrophosphatase (MazG superfamily)